MGLSGTDRDWERYGAIDPYFGVLTDDRYRRGRLTATTLDEFFASGEAHLNSLFAAIRAHVDPAFHPQRALDFGCGVGRVLVPLAQRCSEAVGVDVSQSMLDEASKNCAARSLDNVRLVKSDDSLTSLSGRFDFIHSMIVFQHINPQRGERMCAELISRLSPGGVGALHFLYAKPLPSLNWKGKVAYGAGGPYRFARAIKRRYFGRPKMDMNVYQFNQLLSLLSARGADSCHLQFTNHDAHLGAILLFKAGAE